MGITYVLTAEGQRVAMFYSKLEQRLLRPLLAADQLSAPPPLRQAPATVDADVQAYIERSRLRNAA